MEEGKSKRKPTVFYSREKSHHRQKSLHHLQVIIVKVCFAELVLQLTVSIPLAMSVGIVYVTDSDSSHD